MPHRFPELLWVKLLIVHLTRGEGVGRYLRHIIALILITAQRETNLNMVRIIFLGIGIQLRKTSRRLYLNLFTPPRLQRRTKALAPQRLLTIYIHIVRDIRLRILSVIMHGKFYPSILAVVPAFADA